MVGSEDKAGYDYRRICGWCRDRGRVLSVAADSVHHRLSGGPVCYRNRSGGKAMTYFKTGPARTEGCTFWQRHHFFTGLGISLIGFWLIFQASHWCWFFFALSLWVAGDDVEQHRRQIKQLKTLYYYDTYSFWHWWPEEMLSAIKHKLGL
jgi:hypothetical protein